MNIFKRFLSRGLLVLGLLGSGVFCDLAAAGGINAPLTVGTGSKTAGLVIHWSSPESFGTSTMSAPVADSYMTWNYRFDGSKIAEVMIRDIAAADSKLYVFEYTSAYGSSVLGFGYDVNGDGYGLSNGTTNYTAADFTGGVLSASDSADADTYKPTSSDDLYWAGWYGPNWETWAELGGAGGYANMPSRGSDPYASKVGLYGAKHGQWELASAGISGIQLSDGSWAGFTVAAAPWGDVLKNTHMQAPVPEPATMSLFGLAGALLLKRRGKKNA